MEPSPSRAVPFREALTLGALLALFRFRLGMLPTLAGGAVLGLAYHLGIS